MNIISDKHWESLEKRNQVLIQKWEALQHARQEGEAQEILLAEMAYLSALQNVTIQSWRPPSAPPVEKNQMRNQK